MVATLLLALACGGADGGPPRGADKAEEDSAVVVAPVDPALSGGACESQKFLESLGKSRMLVGASMDDATAGQVRWDLRYMYLAGGLFDDSTPCKSCGSCNAGGQTCANGGSGCAWWGCWQSDQAAPGEYLRTFVAKSAELGQLPVITYYEFLDVSALTEGTGQLLAAQDGAKMQRYFNDWRFVLQNIGQNRALLHVEPDLWGYAQQVNSDPAAIAAAVKASNPTDCADEPDSFAGFGRCLVKMVRKYAPNAKVGLHASSWATGTDAMQNRDASLDVTALGRRTADFLLAAGGAESDFIVLEASDRDAGYYQSLGRDRWWDSANQKLPNFTQAFRWATAVTQRMGKAALWWQLPVGNAALSNVDYAWKDNRVDYLFTHTAELAATGAFGFVFGSGQTGQTTPSTDGGNLVKRAEAYVAAGGQAACATP